MNLRLCVLTGILSLAFVLLLTRPSQALSVDEILKLKQAGVEDRTIQLLIEREKTDEEGKAGLGVSETTRPDGGKDRTYSSVITSEEEREIRQEEREKMEDATEILRNVIIDRRRR